jgi:hypothetical protein
MLGLGLCLLGLDAAMGSQIVGNDVSKRLLGYMKGTSPTNGCQYIGISGVALPATMTKYLGVYTKRLLKDPKTSRPSYVKAPIGGDSRQELFYFQV